MSLVTTLAKVNLYRSEVMLRIELMILRRLRNKKQYGSNRRLGNKSQQCSFGLSGIILWLRQNEAAATDLEAMGVTKMQILRLAHHQE